MNRLILSPVDVRELVTRPVARGRVHRLSRLTAPVRSPWFWAALWAAAAAAGFLALRPVLFERGGPPAPAALVLHILSGISFTACGLVAWRRRPDSAIGPMLAVAGFGVVLTPILTQVESSLALTV